MDGSIEMARPAEQQEYEPVPSLQVAATRDDDDESLDSNYDEPQLSAGPGTYDA